MESGTNIHDGWIDLTKDSRLAVYRKVVQCKWCKERFYTKDSRKVFCDKDCRFAYHKDKNRELRERNKNGSDKSNSLGKS